jgi:hypothetical protein
MKGVLVRLGNQSLDDFTAEVSHPDLHPGPANRQPDNPQGFDELGLRQTPRPTDSHGEVVADHMTGKELLDVLPKAMADQLGHEVVTRV